MSEANAAAWTLNAGTSGSITYVVHDRYFAMRGFSGHWFVNPLTSGFDALEFADDMTKRLGSGWKITAGPVMFTLPEDSSYSLRKDHIITADAEMDIDVALIDGAAAVSDPPAILAAYQHQHGGVSMTKFHYVVDVFGSIDPDLEGPYATEAERQAVAKAVHARQDEEDATFWLDVTVGADGKPVVEIGAYSGGFFADENDEEPPVKTIITVRDALDIANISTDQNIQVVVDFPAAGWELFTQSMDCRLAAAALNHAATVALNYCDGDPAKARAHFENVQAAWSTYGANDTEPTTVFAHLHVARYGQGVYKVF